MLVIRRKNLIIGLLVIILVITGYLNFVFNQNAAPVDNPDKGSSTPQDDDSTNSDVSVSDPDDNDGLDDVQSGNNEDEDTVAASSSFFRDYRFEREKERNSEIEYIKTIILNNPDSDDEIIREAQAQLLEITSNMEAERAIENLIKAKGFNDVVVIMHTSNVNVIVDKPELAPEEVAAILDIVRRESGKDTENIKIIPKI